MKDSDSAYVPVCLLRKLRIFYLSIMDLAAKNRPKDSVDPGSISLRENFLIASLYSSSVFLYLSLSYANSLEQDISPLLSSVSHHKPSFLQWMHIPTLLNLPDLCKPQKHRKISVASTWINLHTICTYMPCEKEVAKSIISEVFGES
jgi:hypothetical protein